jgi:molybdate transport system substrate-binding protein
VSQRVGVTWRAVALAALALAPSLAHAEELLIGAAVSLREPIGRITQDFEVAHPGSVVRLSLGASSTLAAQARAGAPLDVFVSADPRLVDRLDREHWGEARSDVARNALVVVAREGIRLERPEDLLSSALRRIALPASAVPVGHYARQWLKQRNLLERLEARIIQTEHARATLAAVDAGHVDAAIVYVTDVRAVSARRTLLAVPEDEQPEILYTAALRMGASETARAFFDALSGAQARRRFADAGFATP